ncbi:ATP-binding protein [Pseudomonas xionganensis]|uniref:histidine kinase n=1 Tax=Pseudomonas xionganensis TaxID=2654845 RepID=A0A6I4KU79_9PSED|nr:ATP-binding protein [Pseudomonas xionganensis]MVW74232.1 PAS domain S-box protein [Pseudomonas xionganensis]
MSNHPGHPATPLNESERLAALLAYELLDTPSEAMFDRITALAAQICGTPIALISLIDAERQWFKSRHGLDAEQTPREMAFCAHAINGQTLFEVDNTLLDPRFCDNPLVTGAPDIRFYAGVPLNDGQGHNLGTLCVIDRQPRHLNDAQRQALHLLAEQATQLFELRLQARRQHEQAALHKAMFRSAGAAVLVTDLDGLIQQASPGVSTLLGYQPAQLQQQPLEQLLTSTLRRLPEDSLRKPLAQTEGLGQVHEVQLRHCDGHPVPVLLTLTPISLEDQPPLGYLCIAHDLSYREEALQRLQKIAEHLPGMVYQFQLDPDGQSHFPYTSQGVEEIYGLSPEAVAHDTLRVFQVIHPDDQRRVQEGIYLSARDLSLWHQEYRVMHPRKGLIWVEGRASPQRQRDGSVLWHGFINDISARKQMERLKSEFVSTVSHELRTPLTSIAGSLGLVNGGALGEVPPSMADMLKIAEQNSQRLRQLIDDLLDMDKLIAGKMTFNLQPLALETLLAECCASHQGFAQQHGIRLLHSPGPGLQVLADPFRLQQVLSNLLSNALKFSPAQGEVLLSSQLHGDVVRILVSDQGPGISADFAGRIFEKFSQADASDRRQKGGTGLGLAISKELIERMDGQIGFDSTPGQGSTFWIDIPLHREGNAP